MPFLFPNVSVRVFNGHQEFAVPYDSEVVDSRVKRRVVCLNEVALDGITVNQLVAVKDSEWIIWIEEVLAIDSLNNQVITSFDGVIAKHIDFENVEGAFIREANIIGIFYYCASMPICLAIMTFCFAGAIFVGYNGFVKNKRDFIKKFKENYANDEEIQL
ncbi:MAG: hypothetical protein RQ856_00230 [Candidatus Izemoplasmatales bacterium]|nr:hypothetical protein [Candidatus Izemoplasmatales bacterium]